MLENFDYVLPPELIANQPAEPRDHSRLMVVNRQNDSIKHFHFYDLPTFLGKSDVLVLNQTKVFPARLYGNKTTGGKVEILLHQPQTDGTWSALSKPGLKPGQIIVFGDQLQAETIRQTPDGQVIIKFTQTGEQLEQIIEEIGFTPLPPYIQTTDTNQFRKRYQTVYANQTGSVAAPTAGLHFTPKLLQNLQDSGVQIEYVTLHVGLGTFKPVTEEQIAKKQLHSEKFSISTDTLERIKTAKQTGKKITAVGTTSTRVLESGQQNGQTNLFIQPGDKFNIVDQLITNFHIPQSSLLMLVAAFVSYPQTSHKFVNFQHSLIGQAYQKAIEEKYHFYSFGDAMLII